MTENRDYVGVDMSEDAAVDGYVHTSGVVLGVTSLKYAGARIGEGCFLPPAVAFPSRTQPAWEITRNVSVHADGL